VVAERVHQYWSHNMTGSGKQESRIKSEQCGVDELEQSNQQGSAQLHSQTQSLGNVMQVGHSKEERRYENGDEGRKALQDQGHHAGSEHELLA